MFNIKDTSFFLTIAEYVDAICDTTVYRDLPGMKLQGNPDLPTHETWEYAEGLLTFLGIKDFEVIEIPLCWSRQVCVRFWVTGDSPKGWYNVLAGIREKDGRSYIWFQIAIERDEDCAFQDDLLLLMNLECELTQAIEESDII